MRLRWPKIIVQLRKKPQTVDEIAIMVESKPDTVRVNLKVMQKVGLAKPGPMRIGRNGRPATVWEWT